MELPEHLVNKIMLYVSHPVADLFKRSFSLELDLLKEDRSNVFQAWRHNNKRYDDEDDDYDFRVCEVCADVLLPESTSDCCFVCLMRDAISGDNSLI